MALISSERFNWLAAGIVAAALIPSLAFGLGVPFWLASLLAVLAGLGAGMAFGRTSLVDVLDASRFGKARIDLVRDLIAEADPFVTRLEQAGATVRSPETATRVQHLAKTATTILEGIAKDPFKLDRVRRFVTYYLPRAADMAEAFTLLETTPKQDPERLAEVTALLERLDVAFTQYSHSLIEADLQRIDVDMKLLQSSLDADLGSMLRRTQQKTGTPQLRNT
jgi:5-bromo-4-chloroindolyl phosphate hydrolysis protein